MPILASVPIASAQLLVSDVAGVRWKMPEWLGWLNAAQREIAGIKPSAYSKVASVPLAAGTRQSLPADGLLFMEYIRSMGVDGATPGSAARRASRSQLDALAPLWHSMAKTAAPQHFVFEPMAPKTFYVYPPSTGGVQAEIMYGASPPDVTDAGNPIALDSVYVNPMVDYLVYRALAKDSETVGNAERAMLYRKSFENTMGLKSAADSSSNTSTNERG